MLLCRSIAGFMGQWPDDEVSDGQEPPMTLDFAFDANGVRYTVWLADKRRISF